MATKVVLILAQHGADLLERAHHGELVGAGADYLPERVGVGKEILHHVVADQANRGDVAVLQLGEVAAQLPRCACR